MSLPSRWEIKIAGPQFRAKCGQCGRVVEGLTIHLKYYVSLDCKERCQWKLEKAHEKTRKAEPERNLPLLDIGQKVSDR